MTIDSCVVLYSKSNREIEEILDPRIRQDNNAALTELLIATVATGTPLGI